MHPSKLAIVVSKNIVVNGIDIFQQISGARVAYNIHEMFDCGFHLGYAFDELFLTAQENNVLKADLDIKAYKALRGFFEEAGVAAEYQNLYNRIDHRGVLIWGPIQEVMDNLKDGDISNQRLWIAIHEVGHIFREGGDLLLSEGVVTADQLEQLRGISDGLDHVLLSHEVLAGDSRI